MRLAINTGTGLLVMVLSVNGLVQAFALAYTNQLRFLITTVVSMLVLVLVFARALYNEFNGKK